MSTSSIGFALGAGSGLDIKSLVDGLAAAAKAPKEALIVKREQANAAKVSTLASVSNAIDSFAAALSGLISGGSLFSQPSVSDPSVFTAVAKPGARIGNLSASVEVMQIAQAQTVASVPLANRADPVGQGELTITTASGSFTVTIDEANDNLDGLARAINASGAGVTASVVTGVDGARLVVKGATGEANAFTLSVPDGTDSGLERFAFGPSVVGGMTQAQPAQDAVVVVDGVQVRRATNSFSDLIDGVQIDLKRAAPGQAVAVGVTRPTEAIGQAVQDFVAAYNELMAMIAEATRPGVNGEGGPLRGDLGLREMQRQLAQLPSTMLASEGTGPKTLAEIGVRTNRDGTLGVNVGQLQQALASDPDGVEALFNPTQHSSSAFLTIKSAMGSVKPGVYTVADVVPAVDGNPASGMLNGVAMTGVGVNLVARAGSPAIGLILGVGGAVGSATITIDPGLGGALQGIRDALRARGGPFEGSNDRLRAEAKKIAEDREQLETRSDKYYNQLLSTFTSMERRVSSFKATQSYLDQQIKMWTNGRD
ncbi:MAG: flagellar filament capping protein FliD [Sphingomonas sp.]|nr:flagellar filament capping protein FliD [Sphingomonas sp.]